MQRDLVLGSSAFEDRQADLMNKVQALPMHLNQVREKAELIRDMGRPAFWDRASMEPAKLEAVRTELRHLMRHVPVAGGGIPQPRVIDVTDTGERFQQQRSRIASIDLATYRQRVKEVLDRIFAQDPTLAKIRKGERVTEADLNRLTALVVTQNPDVDLTVLKDFYVVAEPLEKIIRSIVGLDAEEVDRRFRAFTDANPALTAKQTNFLRLLKTHIARHGSIEIDDLYEAPFTSIDRRGPDGVFADDAQIEALLRIVEAFEKAPEPKAPAETGQDEP
jgi:type I restriction enzyme R subunit